MVFLKCFSLNWRLNGRSNSLLLHMQERNLKGSSRYAVIPLIDYPSPAETAGSNVTTFPTYVHQNTCTGDSKAKKLTWIFQYSAVIHVQSVGAENTNYRFITRMYACFVKRHQETALCDRALGQAGDGRRLNGPQSKAQQLNPLGIGRITSFQRTMTEKQDNYTGGGRNRIVCYPSSCSFMPATSDTGDSLAGADRYAEEIRTPRAEIRQAYAVQKITTMIPGVGSHASRTFGISKTMGDPVVQLTRNTTDRTQQGRTDSIWIPPSHGQRARRWGQRFLHYVLRPAEMKAILDILDRGKRQFLKRSNAAPALDTKEEDLTYDHPEQALGILLQISMAPNLRPGACRIVSILEGNPPTGVNFTRPASQNVYLNGPWNIKEEGEKTYRLSLGGYPYTGARNNKVTATLHPQQNLEWRATYHEFQDAYTIEPIHGDGKGWTVPFDADPESNAVVISFPASRCNSF
ncbi:hypothetical protein V8E55_010255 [Tylopilus felleus]